MKDLGLKTCRFSISWSRVFPTGTGTPNPKGLDFYNRMIDAPPRSRSRTLVHPLPLGSPPGPPGQRRLGERRHRQSLRRLCRLHRQKARQQSHPLYDRQRAPHLHRARLRQRHARPRPAGRPPNVSHSSATTRCSPTASPCKPFAPPPAPAPGSASLTT